MKAYQRVALEHLRRLLEGSGLSVARFARDVMGRDPRTLQRWLSGEIAIPQSAAQWLGRVDVIGPWPKGDDDAVRIFVNS